MFQQAYQGGLYVEVLNAKDAKNCKDNTEKKKFISSLITFSQTSDYHFDQELKSYVLKMSTQSSTVSMPSSSSQSLSLVQPFVVFQIKLPESNPWSITLILNDTNNTKRRVNFCNSISTVEQKYFSLQVPTKFVKTGQWLNLSIEMPSFMSMFPGQTFRSLEGIIICSQCIIRRILTTKSSNIVNNHFAYPPGINYQDIDINLQVMKDNCPEFDVEEQIKTNTKHVPTQLKQTKKFTQKQPVVTPKSNKQIILKVEESISQEKIEDHHIQSKDVHENEFLKNLDNSDKKVNEKIPKREKKKAPPKIKPPNPWHNQDDQDDDNQYQIITFEQENIEDDMPIHLAAQYPQQDNVTLKNRIQNNTKKNIKNQSPQMKVSSQRKSKPQKKVIESYKQSQHVENLDDIIAEINGLRPPTNQEQYKQLVEYPDSQIAVMNKPTIQPLNMVELVFDPIFQCYIDVKTGEYFVAKT